MLFTAHRNGWCVGSTSAQIDREHIDRYKDDAGFFGFFDTIDDEEVAAGAARRARRAWLKARGMKRMRGPFSLSINEEMGCLVEGFDTPPMILMPHHRPYQGGLIEKAGLPKLKDVYAWRYTVGDVPERAQQGARRDRGAARGEVAPRRHEEPRRRSAHHHGHLQRRLERQLGLRAVHRGRAREDRRRSPDDRRPRAHLHHRHRRRAGGRRRGAAERERAHPRPRAAACSRSACRSCSGASRSSGRRPRGSPSSASARSTEARASTPGSAPTSTRR